MSVLDPNTFQALLSTLPQQLSNGLILGSIYALVALGYTMVYGIMGLINFAHGEVMMFGAMICIAFLSVFSGFDINLWIALPCAVLLTLPCCALLGWSIERVAYRPLRQAPKLAPLISAIGVSIVLQNLAMLFWGRGNIPFPALQNLTPMQIAGANITSVQIGIVMMAAILMWVLYLLIERTQMGRAMRACAQNPDVAGLMGINLNKVIASTFILGSGLAAIAGIMVSANYGQANATMGFMFGLKAFCAAVLGGIGNIRGAMLGGLLLGLIESLGAGYLGHLSNGYFGSQYQDVFAFLMLILVLVFRPSGLLGEKQGERA